MLATAGARYNNVHVNAVVAKKQNHTVSTHDKWYKINESRGAADDLSVLEKIRSDTVKKSTSTSVGPVFDESTLALMHTCSVSCYILCG